MSETLLRTKLYVPPLRPNLVPRPQLIDTLNKGLERKLTLVAAPAGYGKTTLLSEWVHQSDRAKAWLSLDRSDNDASRFLIYLITALRTVEPEIGQEVLTALKVPQLRSKETILTLLINDIAALNTPVILVLDDYHLIDTENIHQTLTFLLEHFPAQMHLVVATRADPHLPIARLRARRQLSELREADLRFTQAESAAFLSDVMDLALPEEQVVKLASRTEGWIAGLQLAAISMQDKGDTAAFIRAFSGSHEYIADYLTDEVLKGQPQELQTFLLETSILERMNGSLCDAVSSQSQGHLTLESLREDKLFVVPLDDERQWYRYHKLFADLLYQRLRQTHPEYVRTLHGRASVWLEQNGLMLEAIEHALRAEDFERAANLIEQIAEETLLRSGVVTFLDWMDKLPGPVVRAHPSLVIYHALMLLLTGSTVDEVESRLNDVKSDTDELEGRILVVRASVAAYQGQLSKANDLASQALSLLPEVDTPARDQANWVFGVAAMASGGPAQALRALKKIVNESGLGDNIMLHSCALSDIARLYAQQGLLRRAKETYLQSLALALDEQGSPLPIASEALMGLGELARQRNHLVDAESFLVQGVELSKQWHGLMSYRGYISLAGVRMAKGQVDKAHQALREARQAAMDSKSLEIDDLIVALAEAKLGALQGDLQVAQSWLVERGWGSDRPPIEQGDDVFSVRMRKYEYLLLVRVLIAQGRAERALAVLESLQLTMEQLGRVDLCIEIEILKALGLRTLGDLDGALVALESALSLAKPGGYMRIFLDEGKPMTRLLRAAASRGVETEYIGRLLAAAPISQRADAAQPDRYATELADPLTPRELQVLRLLATRLTSTEIADELYISTNTARYHIKNIYGKLNVHRRADAVGRAKALGLL
jgi:LuxR family maltose regulon positive regulatory protein